MQDLKPYTEGYALKENEYLLKIRNNLDGKMTGFMTKFNKTGAMPKAFEEWGINDWRIKDPKPLTIYVIEEEPRTGWTLLDWRFGMSQNWAVVLHPLGFKLEIYLSQFLELTQNCTIERGEIFGKFRWQDHKLISQ